jgi:hypothetical protein
VRLRRARCRVGTPAGKIHAKAIVTRKLAEQPGHPSSLTVEGWSKDAMSDKARQITYIAAITVSTLGWLIFLYELADYLLEG